MSYKQLVNHIMSQKIGKLSVLVLISVFLSLSLPLNPFPADNWFFTQNLLLTQFEYDEVNSRPISIPAMVYKTSHVINSLIGLPYVYEFYLSSIFQAILVGVSAFGILRWGERESIGNIKWVFPISYLLITHSLWLTNCFYSEAIYISILVIVLYRLYYLIDNWAINGILIGLLATMRAIPILLIGFVFGMVLLKGIDKNYIKLLIKYVSIVFIVVFLYMFTNWLRFGRFEMTSTSGFNLWHAVVDRADYLMEDSPDYQELKNEGIELEGIPFWEASSLIERSQVYLHYKKLFNPSNNETNIKSSFLSNMVKEGIKNNPLRFVEHGVTKFLYAFKMPSWRVGAQARWHINPLQIEEKLIVPKVNMGFKNLLDTIFYWYQKYAHLLVIYAIILIGYMSIKSMNFKLLNLLISLIILQYASNQVEIINTRLNAVFHPIYISLMLIYCVKNIKIYWKSVIIMFLLVVLLFKNYGYAPPFYNESEMKSRSLNVNFPNNTVNDELKDVVRTSQSPDLKLIESKRYSLRYFSGYNALMLAIIYDNKEVFELLKMNAKLVYAETEEGITTFEIAENSTNTYYINELKKYHEISKSVSTWYEK